MGCKHPFTRKQPARHVCDFRNQGFSFSAVTDRRARPCGVRYHAQCIRAGAPFTTRLANDTGLVFPHAMDHPHFICECCQVRAAVGREIRHTGTDTALLMLERMRMIDVACAWKNSTLKKYGPLVRRIRRFEQWSGIKTLVPTVLNRPPVIPALGIQYASLQYSIQNAQGIDTQIKGAPKTFQTVRSLRSAASTWYNFDLQQSYPDEAVRNDKRRASRVLGTVPTDTLAFSFGAGGMSRRMGTQSKPSYALSRVHIAYLDAHFETAYQDASSNEERLEIGTAGCANLLHWLGWLRGGEVFNMSRDDVKITLPVDGPTLALPEGFGAVECNLGPDTKSDPTAIADVLIAFETISGLSLGRWLLRVLDHAPALPGHLLSTAANFKWTSSYFRHKYAWPLLEQQRLEGEPTLQHFSDQPGNRIRDKVWGMHSWRRGGRSDSQRPPRPGEVFHPLQRIATGPEVTEHGRWRHRYKGEAMEVHYRAWDVFQRIGITLFCM